MANAGNRADQGIEFRILFADLLNDSSPVQSISLYK